MSGERDLTRELAQGTRSHARAIGWLPPELAHREREIQMIRSERDPGVTLEDRAFDEHHQRQPRNPATDQ